MSFASWTFTDWCIWVTLVLTYGTLILIAAVAALNKGKADITIVELRDEIKKLGTANLRLQQYINDRDEQAWGPVKTEQVADVVAEPQEDTMIFTMPIEEKPSQDLLLPMNTPKFNSGRHRVE